MNHISSLNANQWRVLIDCISELTVSYSKQASDLPKPPEHIPTEAQARFLAERWSYRFLGGTADDIVYNCAVALDEITTTEPSLLLETFSTFSKSKNLQWTGALFDWKIEQLAPQLYGPEDIPLEIIDAIENSSLNILLPKFATALLSTVLSAFVPIALKNPQLICEVLISNLSNREDPASILKQLAPNLVSSNDLPQILLNGLNAGPFHSHKSLHMLRSQTVPSHWKQDESACSTSNGAP